MVRCYPATMRRLVWPAIILVGALELLWVLWSAGSALVTERGQDCPPDMNCYDDYFRDNYP